MINTLSNFCECGFENGNLLYIGSYYLRGAHPQDEPYPVHCYYCSNCGKELQVYTGHHDEETEKLHRESSKYSFISRDEFYVIDVTMYYPELLLCSLEEKREIVRIIVENGINSIQTRQAILSYSKKS